MERAVGWKFITHLFSRSVHVLRCALHAVCFWLVLGGCWLLVVGWWLLVVVGGGYWWLCGVVCCAALCMLVSCCLMLHCRVHRLLCAARYAAVLCSRTHSPSAALQHGLQGRAP
eukprot:1019773-Rhodomonas_salina.1